MDERGEYSQGDGDDNQIGQRDTAEPGAEFQGAERHQRGCVGDQGDPDFGWSDTEIADLEHACRDGANKRHQGGHPVTEQGQEGDIEAHKGGCA